MRSRIDWKRTSRLRRQSVSAAVSLALHRNETRRAGVSLLVGLASVAAHAESVTSTFPAVIELSSLLPANGGDGSLGFVLQGTNVRDYAGHAVAGAGDVNGDGIADLLIGAPGGFFPSSTGHTYVVFGDSAVASGGSIALSTLDGVNGFVLNGIDDEDFSGIAVSAAGDVNADGVEDLIIGAFGADPHGTPYAGEVYVVFGDAELGAGGSVELSALDGTNGFVLYGVASHDSAGGAVNAGDVNADGVPDLLIGAWSANDGAGAAYVVFGGTGVGAGGNIELSSLNGATGFVMSGLEDDDALGISLSGAADVNADGIDDLLIGTSRGSMIGRAYVVFGGVGLGAGGSVSLASLDGTNGFVLNGVDEGDLAGHSVSSAGDVNGDGNDDFLIGAARADPGGHNSAGESYVVFGGPGVGAGGAFSLSSLDGADGFAVEGIEDHDGSGRSVNGAGDVNGDGIDDLIIGAYGADPGDRSGAGASYLVFGAIGLGSSGSVDLASLNGTNGFVLHGIDVSDECGVPATGAGDVDGDGVDDLLIGARLADFHGFSEAGESYVVFGRVPGDSDADGVVDSADNCTLTANVDQRDTDFDGFGNVCDADLDNDCTVNFPDLGLLKSAFFGADSDADLDGDGVVNFSDLSIMRGRFFEPPGPSGRSETCESDAVAR